MTRLPLISLLFLSAAAVAQGNAPYQIAETGRSYGSLQQAVSAIGDNEGTIIIAPGSYRDCAIQTEGVIAFRATVPGNRKIGRFRRPDKAHRLERRQPPTGTARKSVAGESFCQTSIFGRYSPFTASSHFQSSRLTKA